MGVLNSNSLVVWIDVVFELLQGFDLTLGIIKELSNIQELTSYGDVLVLHVNSLRRAKYTLAMFMMGFFYQMRYWRWHN